MTLNITPKAIAKMIERGHNSIHIYTEKGGCADYKYCLTFDTTKCPEPKEIFDFDQVQVVANKADLDFLQYVEIDYKSSLVCEKFTINLPAEVEKCGCGISFAVAK